MNKRSVGVSVYNTAVIKASGLPEDEVNTYFSQLESLGLIKVGIKMSGTGFRLIDITKEGLEATSENQGLR